MAGRGAFSKKTKHLFRQRKETIMGIAIGGQNFHISVKSSESRDGMGAIEGRPDLDTRSDFTHTILLLVY